MFEDDSFDWDPLDSSIDNNGIQPYTPYPDPDYDDPDIYSDREYIDDDNYDDEDNSDDYI